MSILAPINWIVDAAKWLFTNAGTIAWNTFCDAVNGFFLAIHDFVTLMLGALPTMSDAPLIGGGDWLGWLNWFVPVGDALALIGGLVAMYGLFLAIRYMLNLVRAL